MNVLRVLLNDFRNIKYLEISPSPGINLFYGANGQGKTNILESIEILSTTKSFRTSRDCELINHQAESASVGGIFMKKNLDFEISINYSRSKKKASFINGKPATPDSVFGAVNVVKFFPQDVEIVTGSPQFRRRFLDMEISLADRLYYQNYKNYVKVIDMRNTALKKLNEVHAKSGEYVNIMNMIESYDQMMPRMAYDIYRGRNEFISSIYHGAKSMHRSISSDAENIDIHYVIDGVKSADSQEFSNKKQYEEWFTFLLKKKLKNDIIRGFTGVGPQRDDIDFLINEKSAKHFGSTGQIKTLAISLKLAQIEYVMKKTGDKPVLLIDDLTSEFDAARLFNIISRISGEMQAVVTCANKRLFADVSAGRDVRYFEVEAGCVKPDEQ